MNIEDLHSFGSKDYKNNFNSYFSDTDNKLSKNNIDIFFDGMGTF